MSARIVVAIDFGTTFSGFAYALKSDPENIFIFDNWPSEFEGGGRSYSKTITAVLYRKLCSNEYAIEDWGWPAVVKYANSKSSNSEELFLAKMFKLYLAPDESGLPELPHGLDPQRIILDYISNLKDFIFKELREKFGKHIIDGDIQWCLTVPAIWDDSAKQKMGAIFSKTKANEISDEFHDQLTINEIKNNHFSNDRFTVNQLIINQLKVNQFTNNHLTIALEPEAASIYCLKKCIDFENFTDGSPFLIVDIGGGTVDLVMHKMVSSTKFELKEICSGSGGLCGGIYVDEEFKKYMSNTMGDTFAKFQKKYPSQFLNLMSNWENTKRTFKGSESIVLTLPGELVDLWNNQEINYHSEVTKLSYQHEMSSDCLKEIFDPIVDKIIGLIHDQIRMNARQNKYDSTCKHILLVGGFSESPYLKKRIKKEFRSEVPFIINPPYPGSVICKGAVMYGNNPNILSSRIIRKTYGIEVSREFEEDEDDLEKRFWHDEKNMFYVRGLFSILATKGQSFSINECCDGIYFPIYKNQKEIPIRIFSSTEINPRYVTDKGCKKEGKYLVSIPDTSLGYNRKIKTQMKFGTSCIEVTSVGLNVQSDSPNKTNVSY